ncbi:MAG: VOC family protein [Solirubrobacteraceae bacterium]|jgi:catechol 2,3-dioxygenase-like lactoylglutathione lyase family enzyme
MSSAQPTVQIQAVRTIGVPVTDQDRALAFYVDTLGLRTRIDVPLGHGKRWIVVTPPQGTASIALVAADDHQPAGVETGIRLVSRDAEAAHAALIAHGVDADEVLHWEGVPPMFSFRDQDGNGLEIVEEADA